MPKNIVYVNYRLRYLLLLIVTSSLWSLGLETLF